MSKKNALNSAIQAALRQRGGSQTRRARICTAQTLIEILYALGFQIPDMRSLSGKHIAAFIAQRKEKGTSIRTMQNYMAHIRGSLRALKRHEFADHPSISNRSLGISGGSRRGTNHAISTEAAERVVAAARLRPREVFAAIGLQRYLGLRVQEAVQCGGSLEMWQRLLKDRQPIYVIKGTKGNRPRFTTPVDWEAALAAVEEARNVTRQHANRELFPQKTIREAMTHLRNVWHRHLTPASEEGATSHSFRYAYAQEREAQCLAAGLSLGDARAVVSLDLGHGDGRGRYVHTVYGMRPQIKDGPPLTFEPPCSEHALQDALCQKSSPQNAVEIEQPQESSECGDVSP